MSNCSLQHSIRFPLNVSVFKQTLYFQLIYSLLLCSIESREPYFTSNLLLLKRRYNVIIITCMAIIYGWNQKKLYSYLELSFQSFSITSTQNG